MLKNPVLIEKCPKVISEKVLKMSKYWSFQSLVPRTRKITGNSIISISKILIKFVSFERSDVIKFYDKISQYHSFWVIHWIPVKHSNFIPNFRLIRIKKNKMMVMLISHAKLLEGLETNDKTADEEQHSEFEQSEDEATGSEDEFEDDEGESQEKAAAAALCVGTIVIC